MAEKFELLGVKIDAVSLQESIAIIARYLKDASSRQYYVVTPNPEFLMTARNSKDFKDILNKADLAIPDGIGVVLAGRLFGYKVRERVTGVDLVERLASYCSDNGFKIMFFGGSEGVAKNTYECLLSKNPKLIGAYYQGPKEILNSVKDEKEEVLNVIKNEAPDVLLVALGAPKQEVWIARNLRELPVKIAIGVGGAFDMICGKKIRAPKFLQKVGLEWFWRLFLEPWRIKRQFRLVNFVFLIFLNYCQRNIFSNQKH